MKNENRIYFSKISDPYEFPETKIIRCGYPVIVIKILKLLGMIKERICKCL